jgi:hypothetical protein
MFLPIARRFPVLIASAEQAVEQTAFHLTEQVGTTGNLSHVYSGDALFESRIGHLLS